MFKFLHSFIKEIILSMARFFETYKRYKVINKKRFLITVVAIILFLLGTSSSIINTFILFINIDDTFLSNKNNNNYHIIERDYYFNKLNDFRRIVVDSQNTFLDMITELENNSLDNTYVNNKIGQIKNEFLVFNNECTKFINSINKWNCFRVKVNLLNVRNGPNSEYSILFTLTKNEEVKVLTIDNQSKWYEIEYLSKNGERIIGWVNSKYLKTIKCKFIKQ